jgi:hypothetical protein
MNAGYPREFVLTERAKAILRILADGGLTKGDRRTDGTPGTPFEGAPAQGLAMMLDGALSAADTEQDLVDLLSWGSREPRESLRWVAQSIMTLYKPPAVAEFSDPSVISALNALRRDLVATGLADRVAWVDLAAANAAQFNHDPVDLVQKIVDDVQQRLQDEFVDTTWPTCARHPNHPMEFSAGAWHCPRGGVVARLGEVRE